MTVSSRRYVRSRRTSSQNKNRLVLSIGLDPHPSSPRPHPPSPHPPPPPPPSPPPILPPPVRGVGHQIRRILPIKKHSQQTPASYPYRGKSLTRTCSLKRPTPPLADHSNTMYALCIQLGRCRCLNHVLNELSSRSRLVFVLTMILLVITIYYGTIRTLSEFHFGIYLFANGRFRVTYYCP